MQSPESAAGTTYAHLTALVMDDDPIFQDWLAICLRELGVARQFKAASGRAALDLLSRAECGIDLVICDLDMPEMDGMEFLRHMALSGSHAAVVIISSFDSSIMRSVEIMAGKSGIAVLGALQKPISRDALAKLLSRHYAGNLPPQPRIIVNIAESDLLCGLDANEFVPHYQPIINLKSGLLVGVEALARWQHPAHGLLLPANFLALVEQVNVMDQLTRRIADAAIGDLANLRKAGLDISLSLNISLSALDNDYLAVEIPARLNLLGLTTADIRLEATESIAALSWTGALETLSRLRLRGYRLSIVDFGTGFSTFNRLSNFPFTELKIDQSFVHDAAQNTDRAAIVEACVALARRMHLNVVAEGVETAEDREFVTRAGVDEAQGALIAMPMPRDAFVAWASMWPAPADTKDGVAITREARDK